MDGSYEIHVNPGYGKKRFSRRELSDIGISMVVLAVAFMILDRNQTIMTVLDYHFGSTGRWVVLFGICLVLVVFSFLLHEFGHKFVAQKYGMWSEYRMFPMGLVLTLVTSLIGFLFAAPGAVYIEGYADREKNGRISFAGPIVNIVLAAIGLVSIMVMNDSPYYLNDTSFLMILVLMMLVSLNSFLAVFNLLPIGPLDGGKIFAWNKVVWVVMFVVSIAMLACVYTVIEITYYPYPNLFS